MEYVTYTYYKSIYGENSMPETDFNRLSWEACRRVDALTLNKLKFAYPTDPDAIEAVKRCVCKLIEIAYQIEAASKRVSEGQGYVTDDSGALRGKVVSSVSSGSESISYTAKGEGGSTLIDAVLSDKTAQEKLYADTIKEYLSMVPDSNGVNLLYRGIPYPYRNAPISKPPEEKPEDKPEDNGGSGKDGFSPIIVENAGNNANTYRLDITTADGTFTTPNLMAKVAPRLLCYSVFPPSVEIKEGSEKSILYEYFTGAAPTAGANGMMIYSQNPHTYMANFKAKNVVEDAYVDIEIMSDPIRIDSDEFANQTISIGSIIIWSGTADNVPNGWHICDGTDGTPDLTDKFVLGAGTAHSVGETGGEETHKLTVEEIPEHYHTVDANASGTTSGQMHGAVIIKSDGAIKRASSEVGGNKSHNNMPPYYALCYIMKVS